jgi:Bacterial PH domain
MNNNFKVDTVEYLVWEGRPHQAINLKFYAMYGFGLLITIPLIFSYTIIGLIGTAGLAFLIFDKYVEARDTKYALTHERMKIIRGGLLTGKQIYEIRISDLQDVQSDASFVDQIFGVSTIILVFLGDPVGINRLIYEKKAHIMQGIREPEKTFELIRTGIKETDNRVTLDEKNRYSFDFNNQKKDSPKLLR